LLITILKVKEQVPPIAGTPATVTPLLIAWVIEPSVKSLRHTNRLSVSFAFDLIQKSTVKGEKEKFSGLVDIMTQISQYQAD
jgi:hypothetical protein